MENAGEGVKNVAKFSVCLAFASCLYVARQMGIDNPLLERYMHPHENRDATRDTSPLETPPFSDKRSV